MMPHAGGQYVYLREAYNPLVGFLYGWTFFLVIQTGTIAAVAVAFAKFTAVLFPSLGDANVLFQAGPAEADGAEAPGNRQRRGPDVHQHARHRRREAGPELFTIAKDASRCVGLIGLGILVGRNSLGGRQRQPQPTFWERPGPVARRVRSAPWNRSRGSVLLGGDRGGDGRFALLERRLEQHHVHGGRGGQPPAERSRSAWRSAREW